MKCSLLTLSCALDGELSRERQSELEAHLVTCERCRTGMRYLREETERISQLVKVELPSGTATALLERAKIVATPLPSAATPTSPPPKPLAVHEQVADPFNLMGIGTPVVESADPPAEEAAAPKVAEELFADTTEEPAAQAPTAPETPAESLDQELSRGVMSEIENPEPAVDGSIPVTGSAPYRPDAAGEPLPSAPAPLAEQGDQASAAGPETGPDQPGAPALEGPKVEPPSGPAVDPDPPAWKLADTAGPGAPGGAPVPGDRPYSGPLEALAGEAAGTAALDGEDNPVPLGQAFDHSAETPIELPPLPLSGSPALTPPPPSIREPASSGWQPNGELKLAPGDIAAAEPEAEALGGEGLFGRMGAALPPGSAAAQSVFSPLRPAEAAMSGLAGSGGRAATPVGRRPAEAPGGRGGRSQPITKKTGESRSWTRTATIAIAAVAIVLIGWSLLHHSSSPAPHHAHKTAPVKAKATPTTPPTAKATPTSTPSLTLTSTQSFGGIGSGYQVQSARYGLHDNNAQFWVVFQLVSGTGAPKITTGFDGAQTLYVEMAGTAAGTAVAQPASGSLVTSVTVGHVSGFSGAVYVLQLSRAAQVSGSLLPGSPTGSAGERVVLILQ